MRLSLKCFTCVLSQDRKKEGRGKVDYVEAHIERAIGLKGGNRTTVLAVHHKTLNRPGEE
jgi:hypothetical protein